MPLYEYECSTHGTFESSASLADYREPSACPRCGAASPRVVLTAVALAAMPALVRKAHAINDVSRSAPKSSAQLKHGTGCRCCSGTRLTGKTASSQGARGFPDRRPWMISH